MVFEFSHAAHTVQRSAPRALSTTASILAFVCALFTLGVTLDASAKEKEKAAGKSEQKADGKGTKSETEKEPEQPQEDVPDDPGEEAVSDESGGGSTSASASLSGASTEASTPVGDGPGNTIIFFDGGFRSDLGTQLQRETVGRLEEETNMDVKAFGPMFHIGLLTKLFWKFRVGVGVGYGFNYTLKERQTPFEREEMAEQQVWVLGQLHTVDGRLEFSQPLGDGFFVVATPRGGLSMIAIGEDLKAATNELEGSHAVRQGPRLGVLFGGDVGVRYMLKPWFSLRATAGYAYTMQSLLKATRRGDAADSERLWRFSSARFGSNLALEASF